MLGKQKVLAGILGITVVVAGLFGRADMILDRPFFYVIKNRGQVIFMGICEDPLG